MINYKCYWATKIGEAKLLDDVAPNIMAIGFLATQKEKG